MNRLAIAIPTFGKAPFLAECLRSIATQTQPVECVVCDGGSNFNFSDPQWNWVKYRRLIPDPGMVTCWTEAAHLSQTEYLAFLADDNGLEPEFAEKMIDFMDSNPTCDVVFCNQYVMDAAGIVDVEASRKFTQQYGRDRLQNGLLSSSDTIHLIKNNSIPLEACVIRRSVWYQYGPFMKQAHGAFDLHFFTNLLVQGVQFGFCSNYLTRFRVHPNSYTARGSEEHLRGTVLALRSLSSSNQEINQLLRKLEIQYTGHLLRRDIPSRERADLQKRLCTSLFGLQALTKSNILYYLGKFLPRSLLQPAQIAKH